MATNIHRIAIPTILDVSKGSIKNLGSILKINGFSKVEIHFGTGLFNLFGEEIIDSIKENNITLVSKDEIDDIEMNEIVQRAFSRPNEADAIIGIGGGKAIDASKYMAFLRKLPFISVPTSTSNDGFSSSNTSLIVNNRRTSVNAAMPYGIIVDIDIIKSAPEKFIYSGVGDLVSKITALQDWKFEEYNGRTKVDDFAFMISKKAVNSFVRTEYTTIKDDFFLKELVDSLTMSGIAMEIAGDSAPTSGSEHLISHALDKLSEKPQLHGIQVGIATYIMSKVQNHRYQRITKIFEDTGFFTHVKSLKMQKSDFEKAIETAPSIKPSRYTYIHVKNYRDEAKRLLFSDKILKDILV